jgi:hypothetical protein
MRAALAINAERKEMRSGRVGQGDSRGIGDNVTAVYEMTENSAHAVVVGANGDSVYLR